MNALITTNSLPPALRDHLANMPMDDDLGAGITGGFAVISYKGKNWRTKFRGDDKLITRNDVHGDGSKDPAQSIEVVIIKASPNIAKVYYEKGFTEGDMSPPDCWSTNGIQPDPGATKIQNTTCAGCLKNVFGSKTTDNGKKAKACSDTKRLAVVPLGDIENEAFGGPMLLRIPAASLKEIKSYSVALNQRGLPYYAVATKVQFDTDEAFPKLLFEPLRVLDNDEVIQILNLRGDVRVATILDQAIEAAHGEVDRPNEPAGGDAFSKLGPLPTALTGVTPEEIKTTAVQVPAGETDDERELREFKEMKAAKAAKAKAEAEAAAAKAAAEAAAEAAAAKPEETEEEREFREFKEAKAKAMAAASSAPAAKPVKAAKKDTPKEEPKADAPAATPASFDALLEGLVP